MSQCLSPVPRVIQRPGASLRDGLVWQIPAAVICVFVAGYVFAHLPGPSLNNVSGDTTTLVNGARSAAYCLSHGIHSDCDSPAHPVGQYALYQYIPAFVFVKLGMGNFSIYKVLTIISLLSFCGLIGLSGWTAALTGRRSAPAAIILILTISPMLYYAWSTFGESLAVFLVALSAIAALRRWPPVLIGVTACLACLTKDTIFPMVAVLGAVSLWATPIGSRDLRRGHWIALAAGIVLGVALTAGFNWFRWHQVTNAIYLLPQEQVPGTLRRLGLAVTLWLAPNGGTALFWPLAAALTIGVIAIAVRELTRRPVSWIRAAPALGIIFVLLAQTGLLASWYDPFGWYSYGPRLMLPVIPAVVVVAVVMYSGEIEAALRSALAGPVRALILTILVIVIALPQVNVLAAGIETSSIFAPDRTCPTTPEVGVDTDAYYYRCTFHRAWGVHWVLADSYRAVKGGWGAIYAVVFGGSWIWLLLVGTASVSPEGRRPETGKLPSVLVGTTGSS